MNTRQSVNLFIRIFLLAGVLCVAGCGQKGDLYLPGKAQAAIVVPVFFS